MKVTFYVVRHGETRFNLAGRIQGACDSPLTEKGVEDARQASLALKDITFDRAYCSTSGRARETAAIIMARHSARLEPRKDLVEVDFGTIDGERIRDVLPEIIRRRERDEWEDIGGEDQRHVIRRIHEAFGSILEECHDGDRVLIVSHGAFIRNILEELAAVDLNACEGAEPGKVQMPNGGIVVLQFQDGRWRMAAMPQEPRQFRDIRA